MLSYMTFLGDGSCQCGVKNANTTSKIVGGHPADKHEYPWMVALAYRWRKTPRCGGSLITERHVLTAAHCFKDETKEGIQVLVGFHTVQYDQKDFTEHDVSNKSMILLILLSTMISPS